MRRNIGGSIPLETAVALPLFIICVLAIVEFVLYFSYKSGLNYAAYRAVDYASKLKVDLKTDNCTASATAQQDCDEYVQTVNSVLDECNKAALSFHSEAGHSGKVRAYGTRHYFEAPQDTLPVGSIHDSVCAFLRPGEKVEFIDENRTHVSFLEHPLRAFSDPNDPNNLNGGWPKSYETWNSILNQKPLVVHIKAEYIPLTPLIPRIPIEITQVAFRKSAKTGHGFSAPASAPTARPTATTATGTAIPTVPGYTPQPTASCDVCRANPPCNQCGCWPTPCPDG